MRPEVEELDFRPITRPDYDTSITIGEIPWIRCGAVRIDEEHGHYGSRAIRAWLKGGATDPEHDSAFAFVFDVVGLKFEFAFHSFQFTGWIGGTEPNGLRIPSADYDPFKGSSRCKDCRGEEGHRIVPPGFYVPPKNPELWQQVVGQMVKISVGPGA